MAHKWINNYKQRAKFLPKLRGIYRTALRSYTNDFIDRIKNCNSFEEIEKISKYYLPVDEMLKAFKLAYKTVGVPFAKNTYKQLKPKTKALGTPITDEAELISKWEREMLKIASTKAGNKIKLITGTSRDEYIKNVQKAINEAVTDKLSIYQTISKIEKYCNFEDMYRAERIARTELISASNEGVKVGADNTGVPYLKEWISTQDDRTRDNHLEMDGKTVGENEKFAVKTADGSVDYMDFPGASQGSAGNVINCRCCWVAVPNEDILNF